MVLSLFSPCQMGFKSKHAHNSSPTSTSLCMILWSSVGSQKIINFLSWMYLSHAHSVSECVCVCVCVHSQALVHDLLTLPYVEMQCGYIYCSS